MNKRERTTGVTDDGGGFCAELLKTEPNTRISICAHSRILSKKNIEPIGG